MIAGMNTITFFKREVQNLNKRVHLGDVSCYIRTVDLPALRQRYKYKERGGKKRDKKQKKAKFCSMHASLLASLGVTKCQSIKA
jgi:hypothetical protein